MVLPPYRSGELYTPDGARLPYVTIGSGPIPVMLIPGAGDGLNTVDKAALALAWMYRRRAENYRMIVVSRRVPFPAGFTVAQQADDFLWLMERLEIPTAIVECNSAGGPVGQWMAVKRPEQVNGLVLASTLHRSTEQTRRVLIQWLLWVQGGEWVKFHWDSIVHTYKRQLPLYRPFRPFLGLLKPADPNRLRHVLEVLLPLDNSAILPQIRQPTLVVASAEDTICPPEIQREMASLIPNSRLVICPGYRHGNDIENPAYARIFKNFMREIRA